MANQIEVCRFNAFNDLSKKYFDLFFSEVMLLDILV